MQTPLIAYLLTLFTLCGAHKPSCPTTPDPLGLQSVDCHPESGVNADACQARGCCFEDTIQEVNRPVCFFPEYYGYYSKESLQKEGNIWHGELHRIDAPSLYGAEVETIAVLVEEQTDKRLRIKVYDPKVARAEVPFVKIKNPGNEPRNPLYEVKFNLNPFSVKVIRRTTSVVIFDSSMGGMVFSDQFLQLSTRLPSSHLYGLGEHVHTEGIKHNMNWRTWSIHAAGKHPTGPEAMNLYGSHPVYMNIESDGNANMVLLLNQHAMDVVLQPTPAVTFRTIGGVLDFYIFLGEWSENENECCFSESVDDCVPRALEETPPVQVIEQYVQAIGLPTMPPYWALGFQLSRWNYTGSDDLKSVIKRNRDAGIPYDVQWGDVDYMKNAQSFTIDEEKYPDLVDIVNDLHDRGQRYVVIQDPGIKTYPPGEYEAYDDGCKKDIWIKHPDGTPLEGKVWPGICVFADYTNDATRDWWRDHAVKFHDRLPFDGFWIDMNEPSNFIYGSTKGCENSKLNFPPYIPKISGGLLWNRSLCMDSHQALGQHYDLHSLYGHSMINATHYAGRAIFGDKRFLIVSRSTFVGSGQFAGKWLGDNKASFFDMKWSITGMIEMNMFGLPYVGADICGFFLDTDQHLCTRWTQLGAFYPMSRNHNQNNTKPQDPGSFDWTHVGFMRSVLRTRYKFLPHLYTLFHFAHTKGSPVIRALAFEFPLDEVALTINDQFLWGSSLMISPVLTNNTYLVKAYFPQGRWYNYFTGVEVLSGQWIDLTTPMDHINVHVRGGHVIPLQDPANNTHYSRKEPMSLIVAYDQTFEAQGILYMDDGETEDSHITKNCRIVRFFASKDTLMLSTEDTDGLYVPEVRLQTIIIYGAPQIDTSYVIIQSTRTDKVQRPQKIKWNSKHKVLKLMRLDLDLTDNHIISWLTE